MERLKGKYKLENAIQNYCKSKFIISKNKLFLMQEDHKGETKESAKTKREITFRKFKAVNYYHITMYQE